MAQPARIVLSVMLGSIIAACSDSTSVKSSDLTPTTADTVKNARYTIDQTLSDGAQRNTIAFDGLAFLTGNVGAQSFLPPGKVADYSGFQFLRDNDPTELGHNTDFVTIVASNVLHILNQAQVSQLVASAQVQVQQINSFAYQRFPFLQAFRRQLEGSVPSGTVLDSAAVVKAMADLYRVDGQISYGRARVMGSVLRSLSSSQRAALDQLKTLNGVGHWNRTLSDPLRSLKLAPDVSVAVMTYASEMYAWYAGWVSADVYFCPERQGTYFGSFYLKDWPAMGNPNYSINEQLTGDAGQNFLNILTPAQAAQITGVVDLQRATLNEIVQRRRDVSTLLRGFLVGTNVDSAAVLTLSARYGELDGVLAYWYTMRFSAVAASLSPAQWSQVQALARQLGYVAPAGAFLYSAPIPMPAVRSTDDFFSARR